MLRLVFLLLSVATASFGALTTYVPIDNNSTHPTGDVTSCSSGNNPLGYYCANIPSYDATNPDIVMHNLTDVEGRKIEVVVEALDLSSDVCFVLGDAAPVCQSGSAEGCMDAPDSYVLLKLECNSNDCTDTDTQVWYRVTISPAPDGSNIENWCTDRGTAFKPSSLIEVATTGVNVASQPTPPDSGFVTVPALLLVLACSLVALFFY